MKKILFALFVLQKSKCVFLKSCFGAMDFGEIVEMMGSISFSISFPRHPDSLSVFYMYSLLFNSENDFAISTLCIFGITAV